MEEKKLFKVTSNPIVRTARSTDKIMLDVIIALLPALGVGAYMGYIAGRQAAQTAAE